jgi:hypothetical protein
MMNRITLHLSLKDGSENVEFFRGKLTDNLYWNNLLESIVTRDGLGTLVYFVPKGSFIMETVNIVARIKTSNDNYYILQKEYDLAAENKLSP